MPTRISKRNGNGKVSKHNNGDGKVTLKRGALGNLLNAHRLHHGIFARVAQNLAVDPSYVSRVANGKRRSPEIEQALAQELRRISERA